MPYHIIKKTKLLSKGSSVYPPFFGIDLEDDKTWGYFKLYVAPRPKIRGEVIRLFDLDGKRIDTIEKNFDFQTTTECFYTDGGTNTKETRVLFLPAELVRAYAIDENMAVELVLNEVVYDRQQGKKENVKIYEKMIEGPKDIKPQIDDEMNMEKFTAVISTKNQYSTFLEIIQKAQNLNLDINWIISAISLQLQEIAILKCAKSNSIKLDKNNAERVLGRKIKEETKKYLSFRDQYDLFSHEIEQKKPIKMPKLTGDLRRMRARVLHEGYNPVPEETDAIAEFSLGFLDKLKGIT